MVYLSKQLIRNSFKPDHIHLPLFNLLQSVSLSFSFLGFAIFSIKKKPSGLPSGGIVSVANLDPYDLDLDLWQYSLDRKKII